MSPLDRRRCHSSHEIAVQQDRSTCEVARSSNFVPPVSPRQNGFCQAGVGSGRCARKRQPLETGYPPVLYTHHNVTPAEKLCRARAYTVGPQHKIVKPPGSKNQRNEEIAFAIGLDGAGNVSATREAGTSPLPVVTGRGRFGRRRERVRGSASGASCCIAVLRQQEVSLASPHACE